MVLYSQNPAFQALPHPHPMHGEHAHEGGTPHLNLRVPGTGYKNPTRLSPNNDQRRHHQLRHRIRHAAPRDSSPGKPPTRTL
eukprot:gene25498-biopygen13524